MHRLAVVAADPLTSLAAAVAKGTDLVALCAACQTGTKRRATAAADAAAHDDLVQPGLFDLTEGDAA